jgi:flagellar biosynthetic protein FlhB
MSESGEKSFAPSAKRQRDAALKGDVLRSRELATAVAMLAGAAWLKFAGPWLFGEMAAGLTSGLTLDRGDLSEFEPGRAITLLLLTLIPPVLALAGAVLVPTVISQLGYGEGRWLGSNLLPKASRLNPLSGLKRMFGAHGWIELAKSIAKVALLGTIAWVWGREHLGTLLGLGRGALGPQLSAAWDALTGLLFALSAGLVAIALIDWPVQFVRRWLRLKMTQQEVRDEHKESEGAPEQKAAIRQKQRQLAMGGVRRAVQEAQFILTNPTHFAVALAGS